MTTTNTEPTLDPITEGWKVVNEQSAGAAALGLSVSIFLRQAVRDYSGWRLSRALYRAQDCQQALANHVCAMVSEEVLVEADMRKASEMALKTAEAVGQLHAEREHYGDREKILVWEWLTIATEILDLVG